MTIDNDESFCKLLADGSIYWKNNLGQFHRIDSTAVEYTNGHKEWYINGIKLTEEEFEHWIRNNGTEWNGELEILFKLQFG